MKTGNYLFYLLLSVLLTCGINNLKAQPCIVSGSIDTDCDGVPDINDCDPGDPTRTFISPAPVITGDTIYCNGNSTTLFGTGIDKQWYIYGIGLTGLMDSLIINASFDQDVLLLSRVPGGCANSASLHITVTHYNVAISADTLTPCFGVQANIIAPPGYNQYYWHWYGNGSFYAGDTIKSGTETNDSYFLNSVVDSNGCISDASNIITITHQHISIAITADTLTPCFGVAATINAPTGYAQYRWFDGAYGNYYAGSTISSDQNANYTYFLNYAIDSNGCVTDASNYINIIHTLIPITISADTLHPCYGVAAKISAPSGYAQYNWFDGAYGNYFSGATINSDPLTDYTYYLNYAVDSTGCISNTSNYINIIHHHNHPAITTNLFAPCYGYPFVINAPSGYSQYQWYSSGVGIFYGGSNILSDSFADYSYYLVSAVDNNGCIYETSNTINAVHNDCQLALSLRVFIEGFYTGIQTMQPVLYNAGVLTQTWICDTVVVSLHDPLYPSNILATDTTIININGYVTAEFSSSVVHAGTYAYISIRTRNGIETWSKLPVTIGFSTSFNFTASQ